MPCEPISSGMRVDFNILRYFLFLLSTVLVHRKTLAILIQGVCEVHLRIGCNMQLLQLWTQQSCSFPARLADIILHVLDPRL